MTRFRFDFDKALEAIIYIAAGVKRPTFHTVSKILYFADLDHLQRYGRFITGDRYIAMEYGPVPSATNNIMRSARGEDHFDGKREAIHAAFVVPAHHTIQRQRDARTAVFSRSDIESMDRAIAEHGRKSFGALTDASHDAAWRATDEGKEMTIEEIVKMLPDADAIRQHLEIPDANRAA